MSSMAGNREGYRRGGDGQGPGKGTSAGERGGPSNRDALWTRSPRYCHCHMLQTNANKNLQIDY